MQTPQIDKIKQAAEDARKAVKPKTIKVPAYNMNTHRTENQIRIIRSGKEGNSLKRIVTIAAFIFFGLAALIALYTQFLTAFLWVLFIFYGTGIIFACRVAAGNKNYDSKIAWILFLLILAPAAVFVYLIAGEINTTPLKAKRLKKISKETKFLQKADTGGLPSRIRLECNYIQSTSDFVPYFSGTAEYYPMGEYFFEDVLTCIRTAEKFIFLDFFIISKGYLSDTLFNALIEKARAGVDVRIIVDGLGSHGTLSHTKIKRIRKNGIKIVAFEPVMPVINFFINYRNHRKIIVIDGKTGYVGGTNIADEYINAKKRLGIWKDASLRIDGEAVKSLTLAFLRIWEYSSKEKPDYETFLNASGKSAEDGDMLILPYADGINEPHRLGKGVYENIIANAKESLYIMSPYFIVDNGIINALRAKAQSGVDVRLILPGTPDKKLVYLLTKANAEKLIDSKVRVYIYSPGFLHSKVMLSDNECAVVGSINMDFRSFYQQYESAAYIAGGTAIKAIAGDFENTFRESQEIRQEDIKKRNFFVEIWLAFVRLFAPLM